MIQQNHSRKIALILSVLTLVTIVFGSSDASSRGHQSRTSNQLGQNTWLRFSPPDKSFVIEVPQKLRRIRRSGSSMPITELFSCAKSAIAYELPSTLESGRYSLVVGVFNLSACKREKDKLKQEIEDFILIVGGDNKHIISNENIDVGGFTGREVVYENGDINGRVLIVNSGKRIYLLTYTTDTVEKTSAPEILRMFRTFRPNSIS